MTLTKRGFVLVLTFSLLTGFHQAPEQPLYQFVESQLGDYTLIPFDRSVTMAYPLERLKLHTKVIKRAIKAKHPHTNANSYDKTVYTRIHLWQFDFENEANCKAAMDSLLNCFPFDCFNIERGADQQIKITPTIWVFQDMTIYIAKTACEQVDEKWPKFKREFVETFAKDDTEIIVTECGKLTWQTKEEVIKAALNK